MTEHEEPPAVEEGQPRTKPRRLILIAVVAAVSAAIIGVGLGAAWTSRKDPSAAPSTATSTGRPTAGSGPSTTDPSAGLAARMSVTAGTGGTRRAADRRTPIGYPRTCAGAVAAATNYAAADDRGAWIAATSARFLQQTSVLPGREVAARQAGARAYAASGMRSEPHPEWGGFRIDSCTPDRAKVQVWSCAIERLGPKAQRSCVDVGSEVAWIGSDWKLAAQDFDGPAGPSVSPNPAPGAAPLPAAQRRRALNGAGPNWQEYANAPR